jgi:hypothetical protein
MQLSTFCTKLRINFGRRDSYLVLCVLTENGPKALREPWTVIGKRRRISVPSTETAIYTACTRPLDGFLTGGANGLRQINKRRLLVPQQWLGGRANPAEIEKG